MRIHKIIGITIIYLAIAGLAFAQGGAPGGAPGAQGGGSNLDMSPAFKSMDKDNNGKVTKEEFLATGMTESMYNNLFVNMLDANKDGVVTEDELGAPLFDVDTDKDGKCSLEEYVKANKDAEARMAAGGQGGAPGGAPGGGQGETPGGAPGGAAPTPQN